MSFLFDQILNEDLRQANNIELIASENFVSDKVKEAVYSNLTNKYCEGYPEQSSINKFIEQFPDYVHTGNIGRYYGGCDYVDQIELYARYMFQKVFNINYHVNVQPHSGSQANQAAYQALLKPGDTILSLSLNNGGHLTHGSPVNFSGKLYNFIFYDVNADGTINITDFIYKLGKYKPALVLVGASAYPRKLPFDLIADQLNTFNTIYGWKPYFMVDMAHIAGLVAAGEHLSPFGFADIITTTTHKTLRGPRGGLIFCKPELAKKVDSAVFPGSQGGPLMHVIAGKAVCAEEALTDEFKEYQHQIILNTAAMADEFLKLGYTLVSGGTDNHLLLLDLSTNYPMISGRMLQEACDKNNITLNKNMVPNDKRSPKETSGVRIGTAAITTKGFKENDCRLVAKQIDQIVKGLDQELKNDN